MHVEKLKLYVEKIQMLLKSNKNNGHILCRQYTFLIISHSALRMKNISYQFVETEQIFCVQYFFCENSAACKTMWKNIVEPCWPHANMAHAPCMLDT